MSKNPAVETARNGRDPFAVRVSLTGVKYQLQPVAAALMDAVSNRIKPPSVPIWHNDEMDRDEPNPNHPDYILALEEHNRKRGIATYDAMVMFGVVLPEGTPEDNSWLVKLKTLEKHGLLDLSEYEVEDPVDREFLYKRFVLCDAGMVEEIGKLSALGAE